MEKFISQFIDLQKFDFEIEICNSILDLEFRSKQTEQPNLSKKEKKEKRLIELSKLLSENPMKLTDKERKKLKELKKKKKKEKLKKQQPQPQIGLSKQISTASSKLSGTKEMKRIPEKLLEKELIKEISTLKTHGDSSLNTSKFTNTNASIISSNNFNNNKKKKQQDSKVDQEKQNNNNKTKKKEKAPMKESKPKEKAFENNKLLVTDAKEDNNKELAAFMKNIKEKNDKMKKGNQSSIINISIKQIFYSKYKGLFSVDITNKIKCQDPKLLNNSIFEDYINIFQTSISAILMELYSILNNKTSQENQIEIINCLYCNMKESILIFDCLLSETICNNLFNKGFITHLLLFKIRSIFGILSGKEGCFNVSPYNDDPNKDKDSNVIIQTLMETYLFNLAYTVLSNLKEISFDIKKADSIQESNNPNSNETDGLLNNLKELVKLLGNKIDNEITSYFNKLEINEENMQSTLIQDYRSIQMKILSITILIQTINQIDKESTLTSITHYTSILFKLSQISFSQKKFILPFIDDFFPRDQTGLKKEITNCIENPKQSLKIKDILPKIMNIVDTDITNFKYFINYGSLFDSFKTNIFSLNIKTSKIIEVFLKQDLEAIIKFNENLIMDYFNQSFFVFCMFFDSFYSRISVLEDLENTKYQMKWGVVDNQIRRLPECKTEEEKSLINKIPILKSLYASGNSVNKPNYGGNVINEELISIFTFLANKTSPKVLWSLKTPGIIFSFQEYLDSKIINHNLSNYSINEEAIIKVTQVVNHYLKLRENYFEKNYQQFGSEDESTEKQIKEEEETELCRITEYLDSLYSVLQLLLELKSTNYKEKYISIFINKIERLMNLLIPYRHLYNGAVDFLIKKIVGKINLVIQADSKLNKTNLDLQIKSIFIADSTNSNISSLEIKKLTEEEIDLTQEKELNKHLLLKTLKAYKQNMSLFANFKQIIPGIVEIINTFDTHDFSRDLQKQIKIILLFSFFNYNLINKELSKIKKINSNESNDSNESLKGLKTINNSELIKSLFFIDSERINAFINYYINEEINNIERLSEFLICNNTNSNTKENKVVEMNKFLLETVSKMNLTTDNLEEVLFKMKRVQTLYETLISKSKIGYQDIKSDLSLMLNKNILFKSSDLHVIFILFLLNCLLKNSSLLTSNPDMEELDTFLVTMTYAVYDYENISKLEYQGVKSKPKKFDLINDVKLANDKQSSDFLEYSSISSYSETLSLILKIMNFYGYFKTNPGQFKLDDIEVINESNKESKENSNDNDNNSFIQSKSQGKSSYSLSLLLNAFISIIDFYKTNISDLFNCKTKNIKKELSLAFKDSTQLTLSMIAFSNIQKLIISLFSNETVFKGFISNPQLLEKFIKAFIEPINAINFKLNSDQEKGIINTLRETINLNSISLIKLPKLENKLVLLFREDELFQLFNTKDQMFLSTLSMELEKTYKVTILQQQEVDRRIKLIQDEDEDNLEKVVYEIFGKSTLKFLEFPEEIYNFLQNSQDQFKYDIKSERKEFYYSLYSYYYSWKTIMNKIEHGFKLYTTNKSFVASLEKSKTLLKFIVEYISKNSHLYEVFLMQTISILQLIENNQASYIEQVDSNMPSSNNNLNNELKNYKGKVDIDLDLNTDSDEILKALETFDESCLFKGIINSDGINTEFNSNTYLFILSVLYKFIKIFPTLVRFWYDNSKGKLKNTFKNLIYKIVYPKVLQDFKFIFNQNKTMLQEKGIKFIKLLDPNMKNYFEFICQLNDEIKFTVQVKIPGNFPLKKLDVEFTSNAHINADKKLQIVISLNSTLNMSTDNICDNLALWADNCKEYILLNTEPCPVCYYYLHGTDKSLPTLCCRTCKKVFHSLCMNEWFKNSDNKTCPMCRSQWVQKGK